jgi:hypothetical protein
MYALDDKGERIVDEDAVKADARKKAIKQAGSGKALVNAMALPRGHWKEVETPLRWVVVTGVVDNLGVREALAQARKIKLADAFADYKRADIQRQVRPRGGDWSDWNLLDQQKNYDVLDNLPEISPERTPAEYRPAALVDPLPSLKKGTWSGVDHERILRLPKPEPDLLLADDRPLHRSPLLAVRSLDFTVEPGATYRYRARVVLVNPDRAKDDKKELFSPWSEPTKEVALP